MLNILLTIQIIICVALTAVILLQRSEGGALGMGGGPSGFMTARGAGDLLTRTTWILGAIFFVLGLLLTIVAGRESGSASVVDRLTASRVRLPVSSSSVAVACSSGTSPCSAEGYVGQSGTTRRTVPRA